MGVYYDKTRHEWLLECELCHSIEPYMRKRGPRPKYCKACFKSQRKTFSSAWNTKLEQCLTLSRKINYCTAIDWNQISKKGFKRIFADN